MKPTAGMVWDYVKTHWRPELLQLINAFGAEVKPEMRQDAVEALAVKIVSGNVSHSRPIY